MEPKEARRQLREWMNEDLPSITKQKRFVFRPTQKEIVQTYNVLNTALFQGRLIRPVIETVNKRTYWGLCQATTWHPKQYKTRSNCEILLSEKWFCRQWFIDTLAHEMVHQYQWDIDGPKRCAQGKEPIMSHGPSFFKHKTKLDRHGLNLKTAHRIKKWFQYQTLSKC